ncbi:MAG TPA: hypothetical protein VK507_12575 [Iamia sp.]|nr:hypothetical protein [Iamia sp.]
MAWTRRARQTASALAALALGASLAATSPAPVGAGGPPPSDTIVLVPYEGTTTAFVNDGATTTASYIPVTDGIIEGNFSAAPGSDVLVFGVGSAPDGIIHVTPTETSVAPSFRAETINRYYDTTVGDFDGNGIDDVFWFGAGNAPDSIWFFQPDGSHEIVHHNVWGQYLPFALDADGNGQDDIFWYAPGTAADSLWLFGAGANVTKRSVRVDGHYAPIVGQFRAVSEGSPQDQVHWHDGQGRDSLWTFSSSANHTSHAVPDVDGSGVYPLVGHYLDGYGDMIFWYRPGSNVETLTGYDAENQPLVVEPPAVNGIYTPLVGDFEGDGSDDIAWTQGGRLDIWELGNSGHVYTQTWISTPYHQTVPAVARVPDEP